MAFVTIGADAHLTNNHIVPEWCVSYELHLTLNFRRLSQASFFLHHQSIMALYL